ncbi:MAG: SDR family oxidoreductase [Candidatus Thermoplasmatota archaeon]|nr:SDR family oxidoreductase [Candidatus Thermoplasmatota archaeon]
MARIIVSGVGNGMGCNASRLLKSSGHDVAIISRGENGKKVAMELDAHYSNCDLMNFKETANAISELSKKLGGLDAVVHLAGGFFGQKKLAEVDSVYFSSALSNNANTFYNVVQGAVPHFPESGGSIVVISAARSVYMNSHVGYAAGKGAIDYMVRLLANELIPRNIRVNAVSPGFIIKEKCGQGDFQELLGKSGRHDARYVSEAVRMLIENNLTTGQILEVDAGFSSRVPSGI